MKILKRIWDLWLAFAKKIGNFNGQVIMTIFYLTVMIPLGIAFTFFQDQLNLKKSAKKTNFQDWIYKTENVNTARRQY